MTRPQHFLALRGSTRLRTSRFVALALLLTVPMFVRADEISVSFDSANKLYDAGKFGEAAAACEKLAQSGRSSAPLYFNLGNAWLKSGQTGRAIAAYLRAERLAPRDPDIRANLQFARNQIQGPALQQSRLQNSLARLTANEWTLLSAGSLWLLLLLLAALQWRPALKPVLRNYIVAFLVATVLSSVCTASALNQTRPGCLAVVIAKDVSAHNGPLDESPTNFTLHDGAELRVLDQKDDWLQVSTDPSRIGWLHRDQVLLLQ